MSILHKVRLGYSVNKSDSDSVVSAMYYNSYANLKCETFKIITMTI